MNLEGYLVLPVQIISWHWLLVSHILPYILVTLTQRGAGGTAEEHACIWCFYEEPIGESTCWCSILCQQYKQGKTGVWILLQTCFVTIQDLWTIPESTCPTTPVSLIYSSDFWRICSHLITDGLLLLTQVIHNMWVSLDTFTTLVDTPTMQVDTSLVGILCNNLLILCHDPPEGKDASSPVDLWDLMKLQKMWILNLQKRSNKVF